METALSTITIGGSISTEVVIFDFDLNSIEDIDVLEKRLNIEKRIDISNRCVKVVNIVKIIKDGTASVKANLEKEIKEAENKRKEIKAKEISVSEELKKLRESIKMMGSEINSAEIDRIKKNTKRSY